MERQFFLNAVWNGFLVKYLPNEKKGAKKKNAKNGKNLIFSPVSTFDGGSGVVMQKGTLGWFYYEWVID